MRRAAAVLGALALVMSTVGVFAQAKPSFAGTWTLVPSGDAAGGGGGGRGGGRGGGGGGGFSCGQQCTITQDASMLKIDRMAGENTISMTFKLDGTESSNTVTMGRGGEQTVTATAMWEGNNLVVTSAGGRGGGQVKTVVAMADGMMTITTTRPGRQGGDPTTTTQTYKKN